LEQGRKKIVVSILKSTNQPTAALRFARYLGARDRGLMQWEKYHFQPAVGDAWAETPHVVLFSGGVNRLAVEDLIQRFQEREGVEIDTVYNGCGILVGQMKLGERPDAYFSCDVSFVNQVKDIFMDPLNVSETDMVIVVEKGNPLHIKSLQDLTRPNLRLGVANAEQSALGALTRRLLEQMKIYDSILENVKSQTPTADLLVNQIRTGSLDAVIVYEANTPYVRDKLEIIPIDHPAAKAIQPYAVGKESLYPNLMSRLMDAICSETSRSKFESMGFRWLAGKENP
ncbi:MAG: substrate-binding domain-containing protein, partial [Candidatus Omnitrophica bacterium]|nr:substrate-binding domain-containing protein [Candidatus Omnitrophota bacterium]